MSRRQDAIPLLVALIVLLAYVVVGLVYRVECGPTKVAVVGWFGPECVGR